MDSKIIMLASIKWSVEDYHLMIQSGVFNNRACELIDGEIVEVSPESPLLRFTNDSIAEYLRELLAGRAKVFESHPITLDNSEPEPDITVAYLPNSNYRNRHPYSQDIYWLVEVANTTLEIDLNQKKRIYARAGINEYWIVNLKDAELIVFREASGDDYKTKATLNKGVVNSLAFPNIQIKVEKILIK